MTSAKLFFGLRVAKIMRNLVLKIQILDKKKVNAYEFLIQNNFANFRYFDQFYKNLNFK